MQWEVTIFFFLLQQIQPVLWFRKTNRNIVRIMHRENKKLEPGLLPSIQERGNNELHYRDSSEKGDGAGTKWQPGKWLDVESQAEVNDKPLWMKPSYHCSVFFDGRTVFLYYLILLFIYLLLAVLGLHCCSGFSLVASRRFSLVALCGFLASVACCRCPGSEVHLLQELWLLGSRAQLNSCGARA